MNTNEKGNIGQIEVIRDLAKLGYEIFLPMHDYSAVDLIAMKDSKIYRLQIKYRTLNRGMIDIQFSTTINGKKVPINFELIDGWAVYCPEIDSVVYVGKDDVDMEKRTFSFRLTSGGNQVNKNKDRRKVYTELGRISDWSPSAIN